MARNLVFAALVALVPTAMLAGMSGADAQEQSAPAGNAAHGKTLVAQDGCYECHGYVLQGGRTSGPRVPPDLPFDAFMTQLRTPSDVMPPYTVAVLSDADAADIYAYLRSLPKPPDLKDVPMLSH